MKKSELKQFLSEEIQNLFELKYAEKSGFRVWLSGDKSTLYIDSVQSKSPVNVTYLVKAFTAKYKDLEVMHGNPNKLSPTGVLMLNNLGDDTMNEKEIEKIFNKNVKNTK